MISFTFHMFSNNRRDSIVYMSTFLLGRWMVSLKVGTKLLVLPRTTHQCKIQYSDTTGVKSAVLTTPKHHKLLEPACDKSGGKVACAPDAT